MGALETEAGRPAVAGVHQGAAVQRERVAASAKPATTCLALVPLSLLRIASTAENLGNLTKVHWHQHGKSEEESADGIFDRHNR